MNRGSAFDPQCPTRQVLDRIGDKWSVLVVLILRDGPRRFTQLRQLIGGVTPKVLTNTLRGMERDGLVTRTVHAQVPPRVDYALTPLGLSLGAPLGAVRDWAEIHMSEVVSARQLHDTERAAEGAQ